MDFGKLNKWGRANEASSRKPSWTAEAGLGLVSSGPTHLPFRTPLRPLLLHFSPRLGSLSVPHLSSVLLGSSQHMLPCPALPSWRVAGHKVHLLVAMTAAGVSELLI